MYQAELRGKLPSDFERKEDILTSNVFSFFKYADRTIYLKRLMNLIDVKVDDRVMDENGNPDIEKVKPIIYATSSKSYHGIGKKIGQAWSIGKDIRDIHK